MSATESTVATVNPYFYAVSDAHGFVGAFMTEFEIQEKILTPYPIVQFLIQRFPLASGPTDQVWAVIYLNGVIAYVSNSRSESLRVQTAMAKIGTVFDETIDFWQHPMGKLVTAAEERLESITQAHLMYATGTAGSDAAGSDAASSDAAGSDAAGSDAAGSDADAELFARFMNGGSDGPIARLLKDNKRISFLENIVDLPEFDAAAVEPAVEPAAASAVEPAAALAVEPPAASAVEPAVEPPAATAVEQPVAEPPAATV